MRLATSTLFRCFRYCIDSDLFRTRGILATQKFCWLSNQALQVDITQKPLENSFSRSSWNSPQDDSFFCYNHTPLPQKKRHFFRLEAETWRRLFFLFPGGFLALPGLWTAWSWGEAMLSIATRISVAMGKLEHGGKLKSLNSLKLT